MAYNYAVGGSTVATLKYQMEKVFLRDAGPKPEWAPWTAENSLFGVFFSNFKTESSYMGRCK
jgi:hypothetical protein